MKNRRSYSIVINELPIGKHSFSFEIDTAFFVEFEKSDVEEGHLNATVVIDKKNNFLQLYVQITGNVLVPCDRCLDQLLIPINFHGTPIVQFGAVEKEEDLPNNDEDIIWVYPTDTELDMTQYFYDSIILSLPLQRTHLKEACNKEMMAKLEALKAPETDKNKNLPFGGLNGIITT